LVRVLRGARAVADLRPVVVITLDAMPFDQRDLGARQLAHAGRLLRTHRNDRAFHAARLAVKGRRDKGFSISDFRLAGRRLSEPQRDKGTKVSLKPWTRTCIATRHESGSPGAADRKSKIANRKSLVPLFLCPFAAMKVARPASAMET